MKFKEKLFVHHMHHKRIVGQRKILHRIEKVLSHICHFLFTNVCKCRQRHHMTYFTITTRLNWYPVVAISLYTMIDNQLHITS